MRRLDLGIPVGHQALSDVTNLCVRECVSNYRVFDRYLPKTRYLKKTVN